MFTYRASGPRGSAADLATVTILSTAVQCRENAGKTVFATVTAL